MKYKYISNSGEYIQGLPLGDLDDASLTDEQKALLKNAVLKGIYKTADTQEQAKSAKSVKSDDKSE